MANLLNWFEIPAADFGRAVKFYETVLDLKLHQQEMNGMRVGFFPQEGDAVGGAVMHGPGQVPAGNGITIYFKGGQDLAVCLGRVEKAGGRIVMGKTLINKQIGHISHFSDTEGNRIGLHSMG